MNFSTEHFEYSLIEVRLQILAKEDTAKFFFSKVKQGPIYYDENILMRQSKS